MSVLRSFIVAFSMYSRIPMPRVAWTRESMRYSLCFFPFVGAVIGILEVLLYRLLGWAGFGGILTAALLTALPVFVTGGIHLDGFLDTVDALSSHRTRERRLEILKDPHVGAFAVIYACAYFLVTFGLFTELSQEGLFCVAAGFFYSRALSGLSVAVFPKARREGSAAELAESCGGSVRFWLTAEAALCAAAQIWLSPVCGGVCVCAGLLAFAGYYRMARAKFGGITGDLAGYFLQLCELAILFGAVLAEKCL